MWFKGSRIISIENKKIWLHSLQACFVFESFSRQNLGLGALCPTFVAKLSEFLTSLRNLSVVLLVVDVVVVLEVEVDVFDIGVKIGVVLAGLQVISY